MIDPRLFAKRLLVWWTRNKRDLPWKNQSDPYKIWLSEIILQQTRVEQGTPYYLKFIRLFPDVRSLAAASTDQIMKAWQGLGYYSRARHLHLTAKKIVADYHSDFPADYQSLLSLQGIGPYTAAAIGSFAFELPYPVIDGNVKRLISRICGITTPIDSKETSHKIQTFVQNAIINTQPSSFNQAIMDFGAMVCVPKSPKCTSCIMEDICGANLKKSVDMIPVKSRTIEKKKRYFNYLFFTIPFNKTIIVQRTNDDIWQNLYEFPMIESDTAEPLEEDTQWKLISKILPGVGTNVESVFVEQYRQVLTHRIIIANFYKIELKFCTDKINKPYYLVDRQKVSNFAFPKIITSYLEKHF